MNWWPRTLGRAVLLLAMVVVAAEATARLDDWVRFGTALWTNPNAERDLRIADSLGPRGRPYGRYQQFRLNNHGFRASRDHTLNPSAGCVRVMTLGASETFGLLEPPGEEYPAQLERMLTAGGGCYEVLNAAVAGLPLPAILFTWTRLWKTYEPQYVVVYPSPTFYLSEVPLSPPRPEDLRSAQERWPPVSLTPRLIHRAKEAFEYPAVIQRQRVRRQVDAAVRRIGRDSIWNEPPQSRLAQFSNDLTALVHEIAAAGAQPVLLTHARRFPMEIELEDEDGLRAWRSFSPRAREDVLIAFDTAGARVTREVAALTGARLVEVDACISGRRELFGDPIHFTAEGARVVAQLVAESFRSIQTGAAPGDGGLCPAPTSSQ